MIFENKILNVSCVLIFCTILSKTSLILRKIERNLIKMFIDLYVKYPLFLSESNES